MDQHVKLLRITYIAAQKKHVSLTKWASNFQMFTNVSCLVGFYMVLWLHSHERNLWLLVTWNIEVIQSVTKLDPQTLGNRSRLFTTLEFSHGVCVCLHIAGIISTNLKHVSYISIYTLTYMCMIWAVDMCCKLYLYPITIIWLFNATLQLPSSPFGSIQNDHNRVVCKPFYIQSYLPLN